MSIRIQMPPSKQIWLVVALLAPVALLNYLDRQMLASMKFSVMGDLKDIGSDTRWGAMLAQFKWVYAILSPIGGFLADRFSRRWMICISLFFWSAITWFTGSATHYHELLWTRTAMGISEALYIPAALALIMDFHQGPTKSRATGVHMGAIYLGVILGGFSGYVADSPALGWRWAFHGCGWIGMLYAVPLALLLRDAGLPKEDVSLSATNQWSSIGSLITNRSFLCLASYFTLMALPGWMMKDWMPSMLKERFVIGQGMAGVSSALFVNLAGFVGLYWGAKRSDRGITERLDGRKRVSAIGMVLALPALIGLGLSPNLWVAITFLCLFGLGFGLFDCNNMPILSQLVGPKLRATGYGVMNFLSVAVGGFADVAIGRLRDIGFGFSTILGVAATVVAINVFLIGMVKPRADLTPELEK